jgi:hypothetical protein
MQLAAVDLGSNSFRLQMGRAQGNHVELQGYWKETVRLAAGVGADRRISRKAIESACDCLARMNERLRGLPTEQVRAVGTIARAGLLSALMSWVRSCSGREFIWSAGAKQPGICRRAAGGCS